MGILNLILNLVVIYSLLITLQFLIENKINFVMLLLGLEIIYVLLISLFIYKSLNFLDVFYNNLFFILICIATIKSVLGVSILLNYIRIYNTVYLKI